MVRVAAYSVFLNFLQLIIMVSNLGNKKLHSQARKVDFNLYNYFKKSNNDSLKNNSSAASFPVTIIERIVQKNPKIAR